MKRIAIYRSYVSKRILQEVVAALRRGEVVAYPTDTAYGLAVDPANNKAVRSIFRIKGREKGKSLPLIAGSFAQARKRVLFSGPLLSLARRHWPGPLTIVSTPSYSPLKRGRDRLSPSLRGRWRGSIAIRVPASRWARALATAFNGPITSTSANISGTPPLYSGTAVRRVFVGRKYQPDILLDAGRLPPRPPSTIICLHRGKIRILRQGSVKLS